MVDWKVLWSLLGRKRVPADLVAVVALLVVADVAILAPGVRTTPLRIPFGFLVALFLPGYVLAAAVFPERGASPSEVAEATADAADETAIGRSLDGRNRLVLSVALSLVLVMATALFLDRTGVGIRLGTTLPALNAVVVVGTGAAAVRRLRLPEERRASTPIRDRAAAVRSDFATFGRFERALGVAILVLALVALGGTTYTAVTPDPDERTTEFYLLARNETGSFVGSDYPDDGRGRLGVGISNHEYERVNYTVVVERQRVANRSVDGRVLGTRELYRFEPSLAHGVTWRNHHTIRVPPSENRSHTRLLYLLYRGSPPAEPTRANAYRVLYLWMNSSDESPTTVPAHDRGTLPADDARTRDSGGA